MGLVLRMTSPRIPVGKPSRPHSQNAKIIGSSAASSRLSSRPDSMVARAKNFTDRSSVPAGVTS